ncbi:MAG: 16S rRNA (uracil(1498)-N(3))-methyltransferase [Deltaproteobacteria bacterium]|nr:16S rRNA (uracil(1498)-N(3))-methyltransferase [Deltaproteobacteria bacterium]
MNLILLHPADFVAGDRVRLGGRRLAHVRAVHRAAAGDVLRVGVLDGRIGEGRVTAIDDAALEMTVVLDREPPPPAPLRLLLALPRPKVLRRVVQCVAAAGVKELVLCNAWRVEKSYWSSPSLDDEAVREDLLLGLEQGGDTLLPRVRLERLFKPFVEDRLAAWAAGTRGLLAHPHATTPCPRGVAEPVTLAIGPEGGFIQYELDALVAQGFEPVSLGPRPLRVEHAVAALLGRLL